ncbi:MAG: hypothetical protein HYU87_12425 [Chloroflexi bacterium]|nr:hypothetical protein [Chloroflexota bacterium]
MATDQWLGQLALYAGYAAGSWLGVLTVRTVAVALLVGCIAAAALARRPRSPVVALAIAVPAMLLSRFLWTERPELLGTTLFAGLVLLLQLPGQRPLWIAAGLLVVWANVHGSFALGAALVLLVALHGLATDRPARRTYAVAASAALLSFVFTPAGIGTLTAPGQHLFDPPRQIQEWALPDPTTPAGALWAVLLGLVIATASLSGPARARDVIVVVPVALLSLLAIRHTPLFAIAATPYLAEHLPVAARAFGARFGLVGNGAPPARRTAPAGIDTAIAIAGVVMVVASVAVGPREPEDGGYPTAALAALPTGPGVLAQYDWGGWLIWRAPATPVFVDGRLVPYRGTVLSDYHTVLEARPGWRDVLSRRGVTRILVRPGDPVAVRAQQLGWRTTAGPSFVLIEVPNP